MYNEPIIKKKKKIPKGLFIMLTVFGLVLTLGLTYAYFIYEEQGNSHELIAGSLYMNSTNSGNVSLTGLYPMTNKDGIENGIKYNFTVEGHNLTDKDIYYGVYVNKGSEVANKTRFKDSDIKLYLTEKIGDEIKVVYGPSTLDEFNRSIIYAKTIPASTKKDQSINISYQLTMWLDEKVLISDTVTQLPGRSIYTSEQFKNSYASIKLEVYGDFKEKELPIIGYITYDMSSLGIDNPTSTPIYSDKSGKVTTEVTSDTLPKFLGWSTTLDGEVVYQAGDNINASDIVNNNLTLYPVIERLIHKITNTLTLTEPDSSGDRFVVGKSDTGNEATDVPNFLWYSGKLWRIVGINNDRSIKLVTQNAMTTVAWDTSSSNTDYSTSQMRRWLNNEFLPTLYDTENLLVNHEWDYTTYESFPDQKATENVKKLTGTNADKVGLLNIYEFMMTGGTILSTPDTYLENGYYWWTMSPKTSGSRVWLVSDYGYADNGGPASSYGARPSVNLKSDIKITGGMGIRSNPYVIEEDKGTGVETELLNNRLSGEYINFNNVKYRIVGIENGLTKITMADYSVNETGISKNTLTTSITFGASGKVTYNTSAGIGKYMNDWYNATSENDEAGTYTGLYISSTYKAMIATSTEGVKWYTGAGTSTYDYTQSKTGTPVSTPIGLGYYGEMFSTQFGSGYDSSTNTWLMTKYGGSNVWYVNNYGRARSSSPTTSNGARPSMYLKSDVKITGGKGMENDPYEISQ